MNITENQSDLTWRKRKYVDDYVEYSAAKQSRLSIGSKSNGGIQPFFITLARESPSRLSDSEVSSTYGSFHAYETEYCRDTSDTESYTTDGIATMDVLEYEVATSSESDGQLYSDNSSSGTDVNNRSDRYKDFVAAAVVARAIFDPSSSGTDCFELQADTEESDGPDDPELGRADYWTCVKCKNKQNNPMYRYCEKCYQIRKTHFPPRPKQRKSRSRNMNKYSPSSRTGRNSRGEDSVNSACTDSDSDHGGGGSVGNINASPAKTPKARRHSGRKYRYSTGKKGEILLTNKKSSKFPNHISVTSATLPSTNSGCNSDSSEDIFNFNSKRRCITATADKDLSKIDNCFDKKPSENNSNNNGSSSGGGGGSNFKIENKLLQNVIDSVHSDSEPKIRKTPPSQLSLVESFLSTQKDSGFSSCGSSQGLSPDIPSLSLPDSQETYCSEIESTLLSQTTDIYDSSASTLFSPPTSSMSMINDTNDLHSQLLTKQCSNVSEMSTITFGSELGAISTCSEHLESDSVIKLGDIAKLTSHDSDTEAPSQSTSPNAAPISPSKKGKFENNSSYGSCMMCLTGPKNGVFVHSKVLHSCCCYPCAVKIWNKRKQCPVCNGKVKNVMKLFVH